LSFEDDKLVAEGLHLMRELPVTPFMFESKMNIKNMEVIKLGRAEVETLSLFEGDKMEIHSLTVRDNGEYVGNFIVKHKLDYYSLSVGTSLLSNFLGEKWDEFLAKIAIYSDESEPANLKGSENFGQWS
jgi:hypothetical protein